MSLDKKLGEPRLARPILELHEFYELRTPLCPYVPIAMAENQLGRWHENKWLIEPSRFKALSMLLKKYWAYRLQTLTNPLGVDITLRCTQPAKSKTAHFFMLGRTVASNIDGSVYQLSPSVEHIDGPGFQANNATKPTVKVAVGTEITLKDVPIPLLVSQHENEHALFKHWQLLPFRYAQQPAAQTYLPSANLNLPLLNLIDIDLRTPRTAYEQFQELRKCLYYAPAGLEKMRAIHEIDNISKELTLLINQAAQVKRDLLAHP